MTQAIRRILVVLLVLVSLPASAGSYDDFFQAVGNDNASVAGALLAAGFDPNTPDEKGQPPLLLALRAESFQVAALLLAQPSLKVDSSNGVGETALMMAALRGQVDWLQRLLARGARLDKEGWTPLHYAASGPEPKTVDLLVQRGARLDALSPNKTTPLMMAARYGAEASALMLLASGANPALRNDRNLSAGDFARAAGREALAARLDAAPGR